MARPREYFEERKVTAVRFPMRVRDQLKAVADDRSTSVNRLVNVAVLHFLEGLPGGDVPLDRRSSGLASSSRPD